MAKVVERKSSGGLWWVREDGVRKANFRTRSEARIYANGGEGLPAQQASHSRDALSSLILRHKDRIGNLLCRLDPIDIRILGLHLKGAPQAEVAHLVGLSQPSISYRLRHIVGKLEFLLAYPDLDPKKMREDLTPHFEDSMDVTILVMFVETTSQSIVASRLGVTQGFVRHRLTRALRALMKSPDLFKYSMATKMALTNPNILARSG